MLFLMLIVLPATLTISCCAVLPLCSSHLCKQAVLQKSDEIEILRELLVQTI